MSYSEPGKRSVYWVKSISRDWWSWGWQYDRPGWYISSPTIWNYYFPCKHEPVRFKECHDVCRHLTRVQKNYIMLEMIPAVENPCHYGHDFRMHPIPVPPMPSNHVVLYCLCQCGGHRTHFLVHRSILLHQLGRTQSVTHNVRANTQWQRLAEMQLQSRLRLTTHKDCGICTEPFDYEREDVDR